jgi:hypothetical protein
MKTRNNTNVTKLLTIIAITLAVLHGNAEAGWVYTGCRVFNDNTIRTPTGATGRIYNDGLVIFPGASVSLRIYTNGRMHPSDGSVYQIVNGGHIYAVYAPNWNVY